MQTLVVAALVLGALGWLVRRVVRQVRATRVAARAGGGCQGCEH
ncbi:MAG: hypothetical protein NW201_06780 [Gemmatimonadales bacterium]|nr:hypothetical protein [Gemmatimonadales bacterium]